jgi:YgiT-type zinc finger domain-containing protein
MKCYVCGTALIPEISDLPFKIGKKSILIIKNLPILECPNCKEYLIEDPIMDKVESFIKGVDEKTELEIVAFG